MAAADEKQHVIVIAIDNSSQAEEAFEWYAKFMHKPDQRIILLHVHELHPPALPQALATEDWKRTLQEHQEKINAIEKKFQGKMDTAGLAGTFKSVNGKPGEAIVKAATEQKATMIVTGTRGLGKIRRTIMGSVSGYVVHHAHCPVLVYRK